MARSCVLALAVVLGVLALASVQARALPAIRRATPQAQQVPRLAPPPPAPVPPNASRITGTVRHIAVWPPGSLTRPLPSLSPESTLYSLVVEVHRSAPLHGELESLVWPGSVIEAFTPDLLSPTLVGMEIEAIVQLTGDTRGVRWRVSDIRVLP